jgi:hypothetical protein
MEDVVKKAMHMYETLHKFDKVLINTFNYKISCKCPHFKPNRGRNYKEPELFMNWECGHPKGDLNCCIITCPLQKEAPSHEVSILLKDIMNAYDEVHKLTMDLLDLFNKELRHRCEYFKTEARPYHNCGHPKHDKDHEHCCAADCPLRKES